MKWDKARYLKIIRMRRKGMSQKEIGDELGCTKQNVGKALADIGKSGEIGLKKGRNIKVDDDKLKKLVGDGKPNRKQLASDFGVHRHTIGIHLRKLGFVGKLTEEEIRAKFVRPEPFGRLTVKDVKHNAIGWWAKCECACGKCCTVECYNLEHDRTKSCGCLRKYNMSKVGKANRKTT